MSETPRTPSEAENSVEGARDIPRKMALQVIQRLYSGSYRKLFHQRRQRAQQDAAGRGESDDGHTAGKEEEEEEEMLDFLNEALGEVVPEHVLRGGRGMEQAAELFERLEGLGTHNNAEQCVDALLAFLAEKREKDTHLPKAQPVVSRETAVGRNDPCPCGSGKKFKKCCLRGKGS